MSERQVKNNKLTPSKIFELIHGLISKFDLKGMTKQLCKISNISTSGFYRPLNTQTYINTKENKDLKSRMNRKKIQRIMRKYNIICPIRKSNPYKPKVA